VSGDQISTPLNLASSLNAIPVSLNSAAGRPAAVLVGLVQNETGWDVIMTKRASHLAHHAGQISFPGGKVDDGDANLTETALREANEEIGLDAQHVEVIGALDAVTSPVGFVVAPIVAMVKVPTELVAAPDEVEEIIILSLQHLANPAHHRRRSYMRAGEKREIWVIEHPDHYLWGLSATILVDLANRLAKS